PRQVLAREVTAGELAARRIDLDHPQVAVVVQFGDVQGDVVEPFVRDDECFDTGGKGGFPANARRQRKRPGSYLDRDQLQARIDLVQGLKEFAAPGADVDDTP